MAKDKDRKPSIKQNNNKNAEPANTSGPIGPDMVDDAPSILKNENKNDGDKNFNTEKQNYNDNPNNSFSQTPPPNYQAPPNYQGSQGYGASPPPYGQAVAGAAPYYLYNQKKNGGWWKGLIIFGIIVAVLIFFGYSVNSFFNNLFSTDYSYEDEYVYDTPDSDYIARIAVEGELTADSEDGYLTSGTTYSHQFTLDAINELIDDSNNKALLLYVDTPGGGVYESDQLYLKIKEYQDETKRPVYVAMGSMAASGGYYISASADKILADRNCWTGSIGVTLGTHYNISGLLEKYGIEAENLTAGKNKAMGSYIEPLTKEQRKIYQSLLDDAYDQFVGLIAEGREMPIEDVKKIADGRIYTAKQAEKNGLIDAIATEEEATEMLKKDHSLQNCEVVPIENYTESSWMDDLLIKSIMPIVNNLKSLGKGDLDTALDLAGENDSMPLKYLYEE